MNIDPIVKQAAENVDRRPGKGAWAPGVYLNKCTSCGDGFTGDKRALSCAPCAYQDPDRIKKPRFKLSPELVDGDSWAVVDDEKAALKSVKAWLDEAKDCPGESFSVEVVEMSDKEVESLPEL